MSAHTHALFPNFQCKEQDPDGGPSGWRGPLPRPWAPELFWGLFAAPRPEPLFLPLPLPLAEVAATSTVAVALARADTTDVEALLDAQTLSALSNTALYVVESNSMSAI